MVIAEIFLQFLYQIPDTSLHSNELNSKGWQQIIGVMSLWDISKTDYLPISVNVSNLLFKCCMYAFILLQENIYSSKQYRKFITSTLPQIRSMSERKADAMAFLYNNLKIKTTIRNQFEKDTMMRKLAKVNKQLRKWNKTVFKNASKEKGEGKKDKALVKKETNLAKGKNKIKELPEHLEEDKLEETKMAITNQPSGEDKFFAIEDKKDQVAKPELKKADIVKKLISEKLGILWKIWIIGMRYATNQILVVFNHRKLDGILENIRDGETVIYTSIEQCLYEDYKNDLATCKKNNKEESELKPEERSDVTKRATKGLKIIVAYMSLFFNILFSNTSFICYLIMIVAHIMNGSIISLFYPVSIFIYALLEERRPNKKYWTIIIYYSAATLVLKFLLQTYPLSDWLTRSKDAQTGELSPDSSFNDVLKTIRLGLQVVTDGRNFFNYFLFEALILLSVTAHMFTQIFGGVWDSREIERESIHQAAARIANIQKQRRMKNAESFEREDSKEEIIKSLDTEFLPRDYDELRRKRTYSVNDCLRLREIAQHRKQQDKSGYFQDPDYEDEWSDIEDNFTYGDKGKYDLDMCVVDYSKKEMKMMSRKEYLEMKSKAQKLIEQEYGQPFEEEKVSKPKGRSLSVYNYKPPEKVELVEFIIENKAGDNSLKKFFMKLSANFTQSHYFETLFPSIKEQKPGLDLYAPMALIQGIVIVFMIFFYTRMDPDYTNITADTLTPNQLNQVMVLAIFIQIAVIVLDRYLYLSRDYVVIDEVQIDDDSDDELLDVSQSDSMSQFARAKTFDLRSTSGENLLIKGLSADKKRKDIIMKSSMKDKVNLENISEKDDQTLDENDVQLSKTNFNKTIVLKYYLQLFLLLAIHIIVFWYFPIKANKDLQITPY